MENTEISSAVIKRLPRYYRYLRDLLDNGITRISSKELSDKMNLKASQIRQDLNNFGSFGQQGYGYDVNNLYIEIQKILGLDKAYKLIIIGAGNIGRALANYIGFARRGFNFEAFFDTDPKLVGQKINDIKIFHIDQLEEYIKANGADIAVFAIPAENAMQIADIVIKCGVKGIWNFSHVDLNVGAPKGVKVENVHLTDSLMTLTYKLNEDSILGGRTID